MKPKFKVGDVITYDSGSHYIAGRGAIGIVTGKGTTKSGADGVIISWVYSPDPRFFKEFNHVPFFHKFVKPFTGEVPDAAVQDKGKV